MAPAVPDRRVDATVRPGARRAIISGPTGGRRCPRYGTMLNRWSRVHSSRSRFGSSSGTPGPGRVARELQFKSQKPFQRRGEAVGGGQLEEQEQIERARQESLSGELTDARLANRRAAGPTAGSTSGSGSPSPGGTREEVQGKQRSTKSGCPQWKVPRVGTPAPEVRRCSGWGTRPAPEWGVEWCPDASS
jgi:hypothetical protein